MDLDLFRTLLHNLLNVHVIEYDNDPSTLAAFEDTCCFHKTLQPMFTADSLSYLFDSMNADTLYEIVDKLDVCLFFFQFDRRIFLIGPYVRTEYIDQNMQKILIENRMPASYATSLKLYYTALPVLHSHQIRHTVISCIASFHPAFTEYSYRRLLGFHEEVRETKTYQQESVDYSRIYQRYHAENHLLKMIEKGKVENIIQAFEEMQQESSSIMGLFLSTVYQSPTAILRALARKAAEHSGLSVITIDKITQNSVQRLSASSSIKEQTRHMYTMLIELTSAVRDHLKNTSGYSPAIIKVTEYLSLNYTQNITTDTLCQISGYSPSYLAKTFKNETGSTVTQYIASLRCRQAAEMLKETCLSIQDISSYVGYSDNNYFVKVFKKMTGMTPSEYRNSFQQPTAAP